jgi:hypothetical protein
MADSKKILVIDGSEYEVLIPSCEVPNFGVIHFDDVKKDDKVVIKGALTDAEPYKVNIAALLNIKGQNVLKFLGKVTAKKESKNSSVTENEKEG